MNCLRHVPLLLATTLGLSAPHAIAGADDDCPPALYSMGVRYQQQSAEIAALQQQAYNLATLRLDQQVQQQGSAKGLAIITDIDETLIDNSELLARDLAQCHDFTTWDTWKHWEREGQPRLLPGALAFFSHADKLGVTIFYISDRYQENKSHTLATLEKLGLPQVTEQQVLLYGPPKQQRREQVMKDYNVVMLLGDTLHDFSEAFISKVPLEQQQHLVEQNAARFGQDWIMFPNASYGTWSKAPLKAWDAPLETR